MMCVLRDGRFVPPQDDGDFWMASRKPVILRGALIQDAALQRLSELDPRQGKIVELRFFGGLTVEETAAVLGISPKTVKRDWSVAKAWLHGELKQGHGNIAGEMGDR